MERHTSLSRGLATSLVAVLVLLVCCGVASRSMARVRAQTEPTAIEIEAQPLYQGCNSIVVHAPLGTVWPDIVAHFSDPAAVQAIWKFDNDEQRYLALYFPDPGALIDGKPSTTAFVLAMFVCISADGSVG